MRQARIAFVTVCAMPGRLSRTQEVSMSADNRSRRTQKMTRRNVVQGASSLFCFCIREPSSADAREGTAFQDATEMDTRTPFWPPPALKRNFARVMAECMDEYESNIAERKKALFELVPPGATIVDIGFGKGPNLRYLPRDCVVIGLEPNPYMWTYAQENADGLGIELQLKDAKGEHIPLTDASCDAAICTLTLCSVQSQSAVIREIARVLKPGGCFIFVEHVIAPRSERLLRLLQTICNPLQILFADGCHLTRDTEKTLRSFEPDVFEQVSVDHFNAHFNKLEDNFSLIRPHIAGYARKRQQSV